MLPWLTDYGLISLKLQRIAFMLTAFPPAMDADEKNALWHTSEQDVRPWIGCSIRIDGENTTAWSMWDMVNTSGSIMTKTNLCEAVCM